MNMLLTTSNCTPTLLCLQAGDEDLFRLDVPVFERMIQVASTGVQEDQYVKTEQNGGCEL